MGIIGSKHDTEGKENIGVGRFTDDKEYRLYQLVDTNSNEGELLQWMRYALNSGDHSLIDGYLDTKLKDFMYNGGKGKLESVAELVKLRNKERNAMLGTFSRKKGKGKSGPNILDDFNQEGNQGDLMKALKLLDGGKAGKGDSKYREIAWKLEERGRMGENIVGACMMQGSLLHTKLVVKILDAYPKLINDVFISEDYYGLSALHIAIVNEDPYLVRYLLHHGADINQRCYGAFFCADDQKSGRTDSLEHEYVDLPTKTNYEGKTYFGEYPICFAACTDQRDCYRLLRAKKADPNVQDTNGNTALHMTVIHEKLEMLKLIYDTGGKLQIMNKDSLTPLTLAAKMAKKEVFEYILKLESIVSWNYGEASSICYPLAKIDTINQETGHLNEDSALFLAAYGESEEHLNMLDGLLEDLLQAKWDSFAKRQWSISLAGFLVYFVFAFMAFMCRPFSLTTSVLSYGNKTNTGIVDKTGSYFYNSIDIYWHYHNTTIEARERQDSWHLINESVVYPVCNAERFLTANLLNDGQFIRAYNFENDGYNSRRCHLTQYTNQGFQGYVRLISEAYLVVAVIVQLILEVMDIYSIGPKRWWLVLKSFPFKICYKISLILLVILVPVRYACFFGDMILLFDNLISIVIVILISFHILFYLRAIKFVGPFVVMIYTILVKDIAVFIIIYTIFLMGFFMAFYLIFISCERAKGDFGTSNILSSPLEAVIRLFIMTLNEFQAFYKELNDCGDKQMAILGKILFLIYEVTVTLTQFNLLIAMLERTYDEISASQKEYKRQWAQVILMQELSLPPKDRLMALLKYSRPIGTNKKKRAFVVTRKTYFESLSESEKLMKEEQLNAIREEKRMLLKRRLRDLQGPKDGNKSSLRAGTSFLNAPTPIPTKWHLLA